MPTLGKNDLYKSLVKGDRHERLGMLLFAFAQRERTSEGFLAYFAILEFFGEKPVVPVFPGLSKLSRAKAIYSQFLDPRSSTDVNVPENDAKAVLAAIQKGKDSEVDSPLQKIRQTVANNLGDTVGRYTLTQEFENYVKSLEPKTLLQRVQQLGQQPPPKR